MFSLTRTFEQYPSLPHFGCRRTLGQLDFVVEAAAHQAVEDAVLHHERVRQANSLPEYRAQ
ncbi:hypothetical protein [Novosphingobium pentaromativorans]|uniref:hypothetical protein n=1 Tax=Novosphingobium pentaromativorans TaxID=205844 RepID=UPI00110FBAE3|nr:hypothetical protein [Novosphingobium pentaromativorans]